MARQRRARNIEQLRRASLIAVRLLVNEPDVPLHSTRQGEIGTWLFVVVRECNRIRSLALPRGPIGFEIGRKNDMLGQNDRAIAKQSYGAHRMTQLAKISAPLMMKQFLHGFG